MEGVVHFIVYFAFSQRNSFFARFLHSPKRARRYLNLRHFFFPFLSQGISLSTIEIIGSQWLRRGGERSRNQPHLHCSFQQNKTLLKNCCSLREETFSGKRNFVSFRRKSLFLSLMWYYNIITNGKFNDKLLLQTQNFPANEEEEMYFTVAFWKSKNVSINTFTIHLYIIYA